ncbi:hypothetical protein O9993_11560 [Vibrio lentus]|nr:hypothetical protein [Vibrio lentus]
MIWVWCISDFFCSIYSICREHRSDHREKVLKQGEKTVISIASDQRDWNNNRSWFILMWFSDYKEDTLVDPEFGIKTVGIHLKTKSSGVSMERVSSNLHTKNCLMGQRKEVTQLTYRKGFGQNVCETRLVLSKNSIVILNQWLSKPQFIMLRICVLVVSNFRMSSLV